MNAVKYKSDKKCNTNTLAEKEKKKIAVLLKNAEHYISNY